MLDHREESSMKSLEACLRYIKDDYFPRVVSLSETYITMHIICVLSISIIRDILRCNKCGSFCGLYSFCARCGSAVHHSSYVLQLINTIRSGIREMRDNTDLSGTDTIDNRLCGVYIYYHPYEKYKIGKSENIKKRIRNHLCSVPSLEFIRFVKSSNESWAESFLHNHFRSKRIRDDHEYFDLDIDDIAWILKLPDTLDPPTSEFNQMKLLDLL